MGGFISWKGITSVRLLRNSIFTILMLAGIIVLNPSILRAEQDPVCLGDCDWLEVLCRTDAGNAMLDECLPSCPLDDPVARHECFLACEAANARALGECWVAKQDCYRACPDAE
jgi:hypothetical protein